MNNNYLIIFVGAVLVTSLAFNYVMFKNSKNNTPNNINNTVIRPIERIIEIRQKTVFQKQPVVRPVVKPENGESAEMALLRSLETATPNISSEPILITQLEDGSVETRPTINGRMELGYLKYTFQTNVKLNILKISDPNNIHAMSVLKMQNGQVKTDVGVGSTVDVWNNNITAGLLSEGIAFGLGSRITKNSSLSIGGLYNWSGDISPYVGLSFKL